jgi:hypothetical protein
MPMFRFTIRDVLWLTVVVAIALALWLGWSRELAALREQSAVQEAMLRDEAAIEREKMQTKLRELQSLYTKSMVQSKIHEEKAGRLGGGATLSDP